MFPIIVQYEQVGDKCLAVAEVRAAGDLASSSSDVPDIDRRLVVAGGFAGGDAYATPGCRG